MSGKKSGEIKHIFEEGDINMEPEKNVGQGGKIRKRILFVVLIFVILLLLLCTIKIVRIQLYSIWSEDAIKSLNQYDTVLMQQDGWGDAAEPMNQMDLIRLYFILGSTRKYQSGKHQKYLPDGKILKDPRILFYYDEQYSNDVACIIRWEYKNNTLIVYESVEDEGKANRYYIDKKHAKLLHDLFKKYIIV